MKSSLNFLSGWLEARFAQKTRAVSVVLSFFGDVVQVHGGNVALSSLVYAGERMGIGEATLRGGANRLVGKGWLTYQTFGKRSIYRLTERGAKRMERMASRIYQRQEQRTWTGQWQFVAIDDLALCAEKDDLNHQISGLRYLGFAKLSDNVFVRPEIEEDQAFGDIEEIVVSGNGLVTAFRGENIPGHGKDPLRAFVSRHWDVAGIDAGYKTLVDTYKPILPAVRKCRKLPTDMAFSIRCLLIHDYQLVRAVDPLFPSGTFSEMRYHGAAYDVVRELYDHVYQASHQHIITTINEFYGWVPFADQSVCARFEGLYCPPF